MIAYPCEEVNFMKEIEAAYLQNDFTPQQIKCLPMTKISLAGHFQQYLFYSSLTALPNILSCNA